MAQVTLNTKRRVVIGNIDATVSKRTITAMQVDGTNNMFTDSGGTTPVSSTGDSVGLIRTVYEIQD